MYVHLGNWRHIDALVMTLFCEDGGYVQQKENVKLKEKPWKRQKG